MRNARGPNTVASAAARTQRAAVLAGALTFATITAAGIGGAGADAEPTHAGELTIGVSAETAPRKLPRSRRAPASLTLGFTSAAPGRPGTPELTSIRFELSRTLSLQTSGLPSCPITMLYAEPARGGQTCRRSLVGYGRVVSEVALPGQAPVTVQGRLSAFFDLAEGRPRILAQVVGSGALPIIYVVPFTIDPGREAFATALSAEHMQFIAGICAQGHPNCFSQTYAYRGIYGHISKFQLTLDRSFRRAGKETSLLSADCPARAGSASAVLPLARMQLGYPGVFPPSQVASGRCEVAAPHRPL